MCLITELQKYMKQKPRGEIDKSTVRAGHFNALIIDRTDKNVSKDTEDLNSTVRQLA